MIYGQCKHASLMITFVTLTALQLITGVSVQEKTIKVALRDPLKQ